MFYLRQADKRGRTQTDWLDSRHTFSFGKYYDPRFMAFSDLRVINDDVVAPSGGFGTHPHDNMEIVSVVFAGFAAARSRQDYLFRQYVAGSRN